MSSHNRSFRAAAGLALLVGCSWNGIDENEVPNRPPTVRITGGAVEGRSASYLVEFFWFGSDPDGAVDHFLVAIDDTCLCTILDTVSTTPLVIDTTKSFSVSECLAAGIAPAYPSPDSIWLRVDGFSGSFDFAAETPIVPPTGSPGPFESQDWHTFRIRAIDDRGASSKPASRYFNAVTIAPAVRIRAPVGGAVNNAALVSPFFNVRWLGRDEDSSRANKKPTGYQLKMVDIGSVQTTTAAQAIRALTNPFTFCSSSSRFFNELIPDSAVVPMGGPNGCTPLAALTDSTYLPWDWYPKARDPYGQEIIRFRSAEGGDFAFGVRAVDQAGAVTPSQAFAVADQSNDGNVIKLDINPNLPVHPHLDVTEKNLLGGFPFRANGQEWRVEVPVNFPLEFEWEASADHYGNRIGGINYALDIPDPGCEVCQSPDGVGGWIGWGNHAGFQGDIVFSEDQADEQHILYIRVRDESFSPERELLAVIVMDVISFELDRTALLIDDFIVAGFNDCLHDAIVTPMVQQAIEPYLQPDEKLDVFAGHPGGIFACSENSQTNDMKLSRLARYKLIYWPISGQGAGSVVGSLTPNPTFMTDTDSYLAIYMQAGGNLILWGRNTVGHLLGDFFPGETPYLPMLPGFTNANYGPGTFLWDVMRIRSRSDVVNRGNDRSLKHPCSGIVGMQITAKAAAEGFPPGEVDPTGYLDSSGIPRTAIWYDRWMGANNPFGADANCVTGPPGVRVAGMDTLYTFVSNSWAYEAGGRDAIRTACGTSFLSAFERKPVMFRFEDPLGRQGKYAWTSAPLYVFAENYTEELHLIMRKLTDWIFD